jgi:prevent-host-death family protein
MQTIGVRELRQHPSRYLRQVEQGETFEVTSGGRPVALLTPLADVGPAERLRSGRLKPAQGDLLEVMRERGLPLEPKPGIPLPSKVLEEMRADER